MSTMSLASWFGSQGRLGLLNIAPHFSDFVGDKARDYDQHQDDDEKYAENPHPRDFCVPNGVEYLAAT